MLWFSEILVSNDKSSSFFHGEVLIDPVHSLHQQLTPLTAFFAVVAAVAVVVQLGPAFSLAFFIDSFRAVRLA